MKNACALIAAVVVSSAALAGCGTEDAVEGKADRTHTAAPQQQDSVAAADTLTDTAPSPVQDASPESSRHWLAPPPAPPEAETDPEAWADYKYVEWLHGMNTTYRKMCGELTDLSVYRDCVPDDPHAYITDFSATEIGELVITIGPGPWEGGIYDTDTIPAAMFVAGNAPFKIARFSTDFDSITAVTPDGNSFTEPYDPALDTYFDYVALEDMAGD